MVVSVALHLLACFWRVATAFPVVRVCVTAVDLVQSSFPCTRVSGYCCN